MSVCPGDRHSPSVVSPELSGKALVVDDDSAVARFLQAGLRSCGLSVDVAYDGQQALDKIKGGDYDVIFCDIRMPGLTGQELYTRLREDSPRWTEQFVFITGNAAAEDTRAFLAEAGRPWLSKPFTLRQVTAAARMVLQREDPIMWRSRGKVARGPA